jgi:hypothetical protein
MSASKFQNHYNNNSVSYDGAKVDDIKRELSNDIAARGQEHIVQIFDEDVCDAVNKMKYNKNYGCNYLPAKSFEVCWLRFILAFVSITQ